MDIFQVFDVQMVQLYKVVQMVPNRAKRLIKTYRDKIKWFKDRKSSAWNFMQQVPYWKLCVWNQQGTVYWDDTEFSSCMKLLTVSVNSFVVLVSFLFIRGLQEDLRVSEKNWECFYEILLAWQFRFSRKSWYDTASANSKVMSISITKWER